MTAIEVSWAWRAEAACKGTPPRWWFPARGERPERAALELCAICPVRPACLEHALLHEKFGLWAGTSEKARRRMRRVMGIRLLEHHPDEHLDNDVTETS